MADTLRASINGEHASVETCFDHAVFDFSVGSAFPEVVVFMRIAIHVIQFAYIVVMIDHDLVLIISPHRCIRTADQIMARVEREIVIGADTGLLLV